MTTFNQLSDLIHMNRSFRRFVASEAISREQLIRWIALSGKTASARNLQPLKYKISTDHQLNANIFEHLAWAGYLTDWDGPTEGERPTAYLFMLKDLNLSKTVTCDDGIALQTILLAAVSEGYGGCIIGSFNRSKLTHLLKLPKHLELLWVLALGKPAETVLLETASNGNIRYWRDENSVHHVPKRPLSELIID